jgi:hypothetical protein
MKNTEVTNEEFFSYLYDSKKVKKWFNTVPMIWFTTTGDRFDVNEITYFHILPIPFHYGIRCRELLPDHRGMLVDIIGPLKGYGRFELIPDKDGILLHHELNLQAKNKLVHYYYGLIAKGHDRYMKKRLGVLKKLLIEEHKKNEAK